MKKYLPITLLISTNLLATSILPYAHYNDVKRRERASYSRSIPPPEHSRNKHNDALKKADVIEEIIRNANACKSKALHHLKVADEILYIFPDFKRKVYEYGLASSTATMLTPCLDLKTKVISVVTCMLGAVFIDMVDQWNELKDHYKLAAYNLSMAEFYNSIITSTNVLEMSERGHHFWLGMKQLILLENCAECFETKDTHHKNNLIKEIVHFKNCSLNENKQFVSKKLDPFFKKFYLITTEMNDGEYLVEGSQDCLCDIRDHFQAYLS